MLRDYQLDACYAATAWVKKCIDPCLIEAPTAAGKAHIAAELATRLVEMSGGKKVLVLAPTGELVTQNYKKYLATGYPASMYSASVGEKCMRHKVVFGSPVTVSNSIGKFKHGFCAIILDECHGVTQTVLKIIEVMREGNPKLRIIGMSATPFRTTEGYVYKYHYKYGPVREEQRLDNPLFHTLVYEIDARYLISKGYLTPPVFDHSEAHYDTSGLVKNSMGKWSSETVDKAFVGRGRLTSQIVADVIEKSKGRQGVMLFASTIQHAKEIMESLPPHISAIVTGENTKAEREIILDQFKAKQIKYLVNVAVLTTGFDAPHVDVIAILRATESPGLMIQIIGRGLRLDEGKKDCLVLDYGENMDRHFPHGDIFDPEIKAYRKSEGGGEMEVICPMCNGTNHFSARKNEEGYLLTKDGYFSDLDGNKITNLSGVPIPSHYGRRCTVEVLVAGTYTQCANRWSSKECHECGADNDIAARYCRSCKAELIDPNEKLAEIATKMASDPYRVRISPVTAINLRQWPGRNGKPDTLRVDYVIDEVPYAISEWYSPEADTSWALNRWIGFAGKAWGDHVETIADALDNRDSVKLPKEIAFKKKEGSKFYEIKTIQW